MKTRVKVCLAVTAVALVLVGCKTYGGTGQKMPTKPSNLQPQPQPQPQPTGGK